MAETMQAKGKGRQPSAAFMKPVKPDEKLAEIIGDQPVPRTEVTRKLWDYIRGHNLQDPENKTFIKADEKLNGEDCGGVYPRAVAKPKYTHIDKGIAPKTNACKAPGEWQALDISFLAPRFDKEGKKTENARLPKVSLNGKVIHEDVELKTPTGDRWPNKEMAEGPIMLQGDHGPVAFRHVTVRAK